MSLSHFPWTKIHELPMGTATIACISFLFILVKMSRQVHRKDYNQYTNKTFAIQPFRIIRYMKRTPEQMLNERQCCYTDLILTVKKLVHVGRLIDTG